MIISFIVNLSNKTFLDLLERVGALVLYINIQLKYNLTAAHRLQSLTQVAMHLDTFILYLAWPCCEWLLEVYTSIQQ